MRTANKLPAQMVKRTNGWLYKRLCVQMVKRLVKRTYAILLMRSIVKYYGCACDYLNYLTMIRKNNNAIN